MSSTGATTIYQSSDLAGPRRKEILENAQKGGAIIRTTSGEPVSMVPTERLEHLASLRDNARNYLMLESALDRPRDQRRAADFGGWAFAVALDEEQLAEFRTEMNDAMMRACAGTDVVADLVEQWRAAAELMASGVLDDLDDDAFVEAGRPEEQ
ncbi:MAG: hypothetical protein L0G49_10505 [Luteococcus sp.]|uniref:hypothetical protein n=1 Tax=Luteococcus sp. TaxID=1969402 RepID=UPI002648B451|nr:hypothetical protein [Luteococcus sp.]MDN5564182.1 hypothetical protein [Luteococcus sp.]